MLVEDNPGDARLVQEMLRKGYDPPIQLLHVTRLAEAIDCLALQPYSAILLDLSLPDGHGLETVKRIGNAAPDVPIVVMSGLIDEEIAIASVQAGAQDYLVKGNADPDLLVRSIQYAIERHRMQRRLHAAQQALQQQAEREALVNRITNALNSNLDPQRVLDEIVRQTASPMGCDVCMVVRDLPESNQIYIEAEYWPGQQDRGGLDGRKWQGKTLMMERWEPVRRAIAHHQPIAITDTAPLLCAPGFREVPADARPAAILLAPIFVRKQYYGNLVVGYLQPRYAFEEWEICLLQQLAQQTALALYNARSYEQLEILVQERTQQLATEKALLEAILNSIQEGICVTKPDGGTLLTNPAFERMKKGKEAWGAGKRGRQEGCGCESLDSSLSNGQLPIISFIPAIRQTLQGQVFTDCELMVGGGKPGEGKWVSISGGAIKDEAGEVLLAVNTTRDITAAKEAEMELAARARQQAAIAYLGQRALASSDFSALLSEAVTLVAKTLEVEYCKILEFLPDTQGLRLRSGAGWPEEMVGKVILNASNDSHASYTLRTGEPTIVEDLGAETRFKASSVLLERGIVSGMSAIVAGINKPFGILSVHTKSKRKFGDDDINFLQAIANVLAQAIDRSQAEQALRESETKFRTLYESTSASVILLDEKGFIDCNSATLRTFGCTALDEFCGKHPAEFSPPTQPNGEDSFALASAHIRTALKMGSSRFDWLHCKLEGGQFPAEVTLTAIELGGRALVLAVVNDITKRIEREAELRAAKEAAEAGSRAKSEFLATMSHELRTPLNAILGLSHVLGEGLFGSLNLKQREYVSCINSSGEHLLSLINDILDLSKIEAGKEQLSPAPVLVSDLCEYALAIVREQAWVRGLELSLEIEPGAMFCLADERRMRQMLLNLLSNAIKFTPAGKVSLIVEKRDAMDWLGLRAIAFRVIDTGIGIEPEKLPLLFEPFRQLDSGLNKQFSGTGLGLALTRRLARLHGGDVTVESIIGEGSEFTLYMPASEEDAYGEEAREIMRQGDSAVVSCAIAGRILVVEDDPRSAMLLQDYLQLAGYNVEVLTDGIDFLMRVRSFRPDLILLDVQLPKGVTGFDLLLQLRQEPETKNVPVVMVTAMAMEGDRDRCLAAGADDYLSKPVGIAQLESMLMRYLP